MNEKFKMAADVEELVSQLEDTVKALDFWAMHFVSGMNDMLVEDDARVIAWATIIITSLEFNSLASWYY